MEKYRIYQTALDECWIQVKRIVKVTKYKSRVQWEFVDKYGKEVKFHKDIDMKKYRVCCKSLPEAKKLIETFADYPQVFYMDK